MNLFEIYPQLEQTHSERSSRALAAFDFVIWHRLR